MLEKYEWLNKKTPRSVEQLRLWTDNPRLNPEETHTQLSDYAEAFTSDESEKREFFRLVKSIVDDGFIPADPIVVWKNEENEKFYVAEGNRRVLALKLLREPNKAPKGIRGYFQKQAEKIDLTSIEKIFVNVAPTFEDAEWYINQRNNASSLQRMWSRIQQQRWIADLYEKYSGDIDRITSITKMTQGELEDYIRILKIKDLVKDKIVVSRLSKDEYEKAISHKFPITILERFFSSSLVKERWGIEFDGANVKFNCNKESFLEAYAELIKRIIHNNEEKNQFNIDTRTITTNLEDILNSLPSVSFEKTKNDTNDNHFEKKDEQKDEQKGEQSSNANPNTQDESNKFEHLKNNPERNKLILPIYEINTDSYRLSELFNELKRIPFSYSNCLGASLRVFLDFAVFKYIETENLESSISTSYKVSFKEVSLKFRLEYLKTNNLKDKSKQIVSKLIDPNHIYSLDVLNGFIHGQEAHYLNKQFLNNFWDFLFPFFQTILDIREIKK